MPTTKPQTTSYSVHTPEFSFQFNSRDAIQALLLMIERAEKSIDLELFYILPDSIGRTILDALLIKAQQGVVVRLLVDSMGSLSLSQSMYIEAFKKTKSHIRFFNSLIPFTEHNKSILYFRNHRRTVIIDHKELLVGSFCIGEPAVNWLELSLNIKDSNAVSEAEKVFNQTWKKSLHQTFRIGHTTKTSTDCFTYLTQSPLQRRRNIYNLLLEKIKSAKSHILLVSPYVVPDRRLLRAIRSARRRKVCVQIITPRHTDWSSADYARGTYIESLLKKGVEIYFSDDMIHAKVAIFDKEQAMVGTLNLDNISLRYNYECGIHIDNLGAVDQLYQGVQSNFVNISTKLTLHEWRKRSLWTKCMEKLIWPFRKFL